MNVRVALVLYLIVVGAGFGGLVGRGQKRGHIMLAGTLGGISGGVFVAYWLSCWIKTDLSESLSCIGMSVGWGVAWLLFARRVPRGT